MDNFLKSLIAIALTAFIFTGCTKDPCDAVNCGLNGTLTKSAGDKICACNCFNGFEGANCSELAADKFTGKWQASDQCASGDIAYDAIIKLNNRQTLVNINNFRAFEDNTSWEATISGNIISIPVWTFFYTSPTDNTLIVGHTEGMGILTDDGKTINWQYLIIFEDGYKDACTGVWTKVE